VDLCGAGALDGEKQSGVTMKKRKLLLLTDWFYPGYKAGGPIQSCHNLILLLRDCFDIHVVCSDRDLNETEPYPNIHSGVWNESLIPDIRIYYTPKLSLRLLKELITEVKPDVIHLNHLYSPCYVIQPLWLAYIGWFKGKLVLSPRGALLPGALAVKSYKKYPFIFLLQRLGVANRILFHATTEEEAASVRRFFSKASIEIVGNPPAVNQAPLLLVPKQPGVLRMVYVARIHPIKNLRFLLSVLEEMGGSSIQLDIIGPIDDADYWAQCQRQISSLPASVKVEYRGALPHADVLSALEGTHLSVLPTDGENFGHSIFESFLAGRPVLISNTTPWGGLKEKQIGWDLSVKDRSLWIEALQQAVNWNQQEMDEKARQAWTFARKHIEQSDVKQKYIDLFS
jgi:glycosyltransferase involved in cell wall biosynthesis